MSNWTSVAGIVRIDAIRSEEETVEEATRMFENYFGKELRYHSEDELWYEADEHPEKFDPREYLKPARANIKELVRHKLVDVLGCAGKAD